MVMIIAIVTFTFTPHEHLDCNMQAGSLRTFRKLPLFIAASSQMEKAPTYSKSWQPSHEPLPGRGWSLAPVTLIDSVASGVE